MDERALSRYLQDHLAGSDAGLAIASRLAERHAGTDVGASMERLAGEIRSEQEIVRAAIGRLPTRPDPVKRAMGMIAAAGRLAGSLPFVPEPSIIEDLEALAVGVWGKRLLWGAMTRVAGSEGGFDDFDLDELAASAEDQEREILRLRQDALEGYLALPQVPAN
jgi:hypothetical protein